MISLSKAAKTEDGMKRVLLGLVLIVFLSIVVASGAFAGELEDQLFKAIDWTDVESVRSLINRGVNVNAIDETGASVYDRAYETAYLSCMFENTDYCDDSMLILDMLEAAGAKGVLSQ